MSSTKQLFLNLHKSRFSQGVFWNLIGTVFSQGSVFITAIILARIFGKETFGEFGIIQSTLLTLTGIAQIATGVTATKYVAEFRDVDKVRTGRILGLCSILTFITGLIATGILIFGSPFLATNILSAPHLSTNLSLAALFVLFSVINGYQIGALAGLEAYKSISYYGVISGVLYFCICITGATLWGLPGAIGGMVLSAMFRWSVYAYALHKEVLAQNITVNRRDGFQERGIIYKFALPAALTGLTSMPAIWIGNTLLVRQPEGFMEMGMYSAANNLRMVVLIFPLLLNNVGLSLLNNKRGNKDITGYSRIFWLNIVISGVSVSVGVLLVILLAEPLLSLYGNDFVAGYWILFFLMLSTIPEALAVAVAQVIQSQEKMWHSLWLIALPRDILLVVFSIILIPIYNGIGLSIAYALAWMISFVIVVIIVYKMGLKVH